MAEVNTFRRKPTRFLKETSDQSGFDNFDGKTGKKRWMSIRQNGMQIDPSEFDNPPPSNIPLGGADISGNYRQNSTSDPNNIPPVSQYTVQYITSSNTISIPNQATVYVSGSLNTVSLASNPQIVRGKANQTMSLMCVGSTIILQNGNGVDLIYGPFSMGSGALINLMYSGTDNLWHETSRSTNGGI